MFTSFHNPELYAKVKALVEKAIPIMESDVKEAWGIKTQILQKPNPFFYTLLSTSKPEFERMILTYRYYHIEKLPEFESCEQFMKCDPVISKYINSHVGTRRGLTWIWTPHHVYYMLERLVEQLFYKQKYEPELFDSLYKDFESFCYEGIIPIRDNAPLHNFNVKGVIKDLNLAGIVIHNAVNTFEPIILDENLRIKKISHGEYRELFNLMEEVHLNLFEVGEPNYAIECDVREQVISQRKKPTEVPDLVFDSENSIDAVITAFRLFRSFFIGYSNIFPFKDLDVFVTLKHKPKYIVSEKQLDQPYVLYKEDILEFQTFWKDFGGILKDVHSDSRKWKELSSAIGHFNSSYNRRNDRDKLIDLSVCVEAIFQSEGSIGGTIPHKFSLRLTRLIGKTPSERRELYLKIKKLSDQRGQAVHASSRDHFDYKCLEEFVRVAIKEYLQRIKSNDSITHEDIINSLDYD